MCFTYTKMDQDFHATIFWGVVRINPSFFCCENWGEHPASLVPWLADTGTELRAAKVLKMPGQSSHAWGIISRIVCSFWMCLSLVCRWIVSCSICGYQLLSGMNFQVVTSAMNQPFWRVYTSGETGMTLALGLSQYGYCYGWFTFNDHVLTNHLFSAAWSPIIAVNFTNARRVDMAFKY